MVGGNAFGSPLPQVTDDAGTPFTVVVIPVDDQLAVHLPRRRSSFAAMTHRSRSETTSSAARDRGVFDARYLAFLTTVETLRPSLHRYCARMTGSVADGEDVVQDALFDAYRRLDSFDDARPLKPWLFRIAHNRCIDLLRSRGVREDAESGGDTLDVVWPDDPPGPALGRAIEHLVLTLPPMERACVLLKDVLDHSLEEIAELVGLDASAG